MNFKRCLPLTLDLLLNANERTQRHLSKSTVDTLKRETSGSKEDTEWTWSYEVGSFVDAHRFF